MQQILLTRIGSRVIRRNFGSPVAGKLLKPDVAVDPDLSAGIQAALAENERRAEVTNVIFKRDRRKGALYADIKFRTYMTHQDGNLVYPFSMTV
jgi:phage baseplate assembly protein W